MKESIFGKKDIRNMNFNSVSIGFEFEFLATVVMKEKISTKSKAIKTILKYLINLTKVEHIELKFDQSVLSITSDILEYIGLSEQKIDDKQILLPLELVTSPLPFSQAIEVMKKVLETIRKGSITTDDMSINLETTPTSGLHINISVDSSSSYFKSLNANYLFTLGTLDYLLDIFDEENRRRIFTKELNPEFMKFLASEIKDYYKNENLNELGKEIYSFLKKFLTDRENFSNNVKDRMKDFWDEKYKIIRVKKNENYAEFRVLGGRKYEEKEEEIIRNILKFSFLVWESSIDRYTKMDDIIRKMMKEITKYIEVDKVEKQKLNLEILEDESINKKANEILNFIDNISRKFEKNRNEIEQFIFMVMFVFKHNLIKSKNESQFVSSLIKEITSPFIISLKELNEKIRKEIFGIDQPKNKIGNFINLYNEMKKDRKFALKMFLIARNALNLYNLDIRKIYEEVSKHFQFS
jgi:hypothetical protein